MKRTRLSLVIITFTLGLAASIGAWTGPTAAAPNGNVSAPLHVGSAQQVKSGVIGVDGLIVFGNTQLNAGTVTYLSFGSTSGSAGYGIRDNAGVMQVRSSGGSWTNVEVTVPPATVIPSGTHCGMRRVRCEVNTVGYDVAAQMSDTYNIESATPISCNGTALTAVCSNWSITSVSCPTGYTGVWDWSIGGSEYYHYTAYCVKS